MTPVGCPFRQPTSNPMGFNYLRVNPPPVEVFEFHLRHQVLNPSGCSYFAFLVSMNFPKHIP